LYRFVVLELFYVKAIYVVISSQLIIAFILLYILKWFDAPKFVEKFLSI